MHVLFITIVLSIHCFFYIQAFLQNNTGKEISLLNPKQKFKIRFLENGPPSGHRMFLQQ